MPEFPVIPEDEMRRLLEPPVGPIRLILDTDMHNEIDDQYTLAWALLSQDVFQIESVLAEPYAFQRNRDLTIRAYDLLKQDVNANIPPALEYVRQRVIRMLANGIDPREIHWAEPDQGMELSYQETLKIYELLEEDPEGVVLRGSPAYLTSLDEPVPSPAAELIIQRAMADDDRPLYIAAIGCLTNVASAILMEPAIIKRIVVLWTSAYPSSLTLSNQHSFNMYQDMLASQLLFDCGVPHVYCPGYYVGAQLKLSLPDVEQWVRGRGKIGDYLHYLYTHNPDDLRNGVVEHMGRTRVIWDLITLAWLLNPAWVPSHLVQSPVLTDDFYWRHDPGRHLMREAYEINRDAIFRDLFIKLQSAP